jgi:GNAT superfamily N-acetyltransferase
MEIPSDLQVRLQALAQQTGEDGEALVRRVLEAWLRLPAPGSGPLPVQTEGAARPMLVDLELLQRIEDAIAVERSAFADGMAAFRPESRAGWRPVAGGRAVFTGADFFSNRALAMGLRGPVSRDDLECVETFYAECGVPCEIEIASMADLSLLRLLNQHGYRLIRFRNIYAQVLHPLDAASTAPAARSRAVDIQTVDDSTAMAWSTTLLNGFGYTRDVDRDRVETWNQMVRSLPGVTALVAMLEGKPVGAASVMVLGSTAMLGGAATLPAFRRQGVQRALIETRLAVATHAGCTLAIVTADPGSSSGRNAERTGFQLICNHVSMRVPPESQAGRHATHTERP